MEYDGIIEYFDTSLVESGTEQESVPDGVVLCVVIVIVIVVITTVWRCMVHGKNNKVR